MDPIILNLKTREVTIGLRFVRSGASTIYLTGAEHIVFLALIAAIPVGIGNKDICNLLETTLDDRSISVITSHISSIRKKINLILGDELQIKWDVSTAKYIVRLIIQGTE